MSCTARTNVICQWVASIGLPNRIAKICTSVLLLIVAVRAGAVGFDSAYSEHAVLQAGVCHPVSGTGEPGEIVSVSSQSQALQVRGSIEGKWAVWADTETFESYSLGTLEGTRRGPLGTWLSDGAAEISDRRATGGKHALRIFGGEQRQITLVLHEPRDSGIVRLRAERWTQRSPFRFSIEASRDGTWDVVYEDAGNAITTGGYHADIECGVDGRFDAIRLMCSSPEGGGILIDDFSIEPPRPMQVVAVTTEQPMLPVLIGNTLNPIARVRITTEGTVDPIAVTGVQWTLDSGLDRRELASVASYVSTSNTLHWRDPDACFEESDLFGQVSRATPTVNTDGERELQRGDNFIWLSVNLNDQADLDGWIDAACLSVTLSNGQTITPDITAPSGAQRLGVAVRNAGDDDVAVYRIPGIATTDKGTLIAIYDIRHGGWADLPSDIDVGMSRSTDGGRTWEPMRTIMDMGDDPEWRHDGVGDPAVLYDHHTDTIWVAATWSHGDRSWRGSGPGLDPEETGQLILVKSGDDGRTWSDPINITRQVKDPAWSFVLPSPGRGITMADGTLVFPAQYQDPPDRGRTPHSTIMYSRDQGETWHIATGAKTDTTECQVVEMEPGTLMLNMRDNRGGSRAVYITRDMGATWQPHPSSRGALPEPVCNAGLLRVRSTSSPHHPWLVFANPNVANAPRRDMTIKLSVDGGMTWPLAQQILLDAGLSAGYPSLTMIDANTVGILYEGSRSQLTFQRVALDDLFTETLPGPSP